MGAIVKYNDPYFPKLPKVRKYNYEIQFSQITKKDLNYFDCVVLITDHDYYDYDLIMNSSKLIIDTRGKYSPSDKIIRA